MARAYSSLLGDFLYNLSLGRGEAGLDSTRIQCPAHYKDDIAGAVDHTEVSACDTLRKQGLAAVETAAMFYRLAWQSM